jgi:hypothetical protein
VDGVFSTHRKNTYRDKSEGKRQLERSKSICDNRMERRGQHSCGSGQEKVASFCENDNELSAFIKMRRIS